MSKKIKKILIYIFFIILFLFIGFIVFAENNFKKVVYDINNNAVIINGNVKKIVSLDAFTTQILLILKAEDRLVAINYGKLVSKKTLFKYFNNIEKRSKIFNGKNVNIEELFKIGPDIIISKKGYHYLKQIENYNFPVFLIDVETPSKFFKSIELIGKAISKEQRAMYVVKYLKTLINDIKREGKNISHKYTVYFAGSSIFSSFGNKAFQNYLADYAQLKFVSDSVNKFKIKIDPEQLIKWNPEVILLPSYCKTEIKNIIDNPVLQSIEAVKNRKIYKIPSFFLSWDLPEPEAFLCIYWIFSKVYKTDTVKIKLQMENKLKEFYKTLYGIELSGDEIKLFIDRYF